MTPERLRECRQILRWSQADLAHACGASERSVRRWEVGGAPPPLGEWLEALCDAHRALPAPVWKRGGPDRS
jgi:transcriptional regulator with XRE-family HTH domain